MSAFIVEGITLPAQTESWSAKSVGEDRVTFQMWLNGYQYGATDTDPKQAIQDTVKAALGHQQLLATFGPEVPTTESRSKQDEQQGVG